MNYSTNGAASWNRAVSGTNSTSADISNADNTVDYIISVRANNALGGGAWTNSGTIAGLGSPSSVSISRAAGSVTVGLVCRIGATGYNINLSADGGGSWTRAASNATGTSATISSGISNGSSYIAAVQAVNAGGGGNWTNSGSIAGIHPARRAHGRYGFALRARAYPCRGLRHQATAAWRFPATTSITVRTRAIHGRVRLSNQSGTSATIANADNSVDYEIAVSARNAVGNSAWVRTATVAGIDAPAP